MTFRIDGEFFFMTNPDYITVGRMGSSYGVKGWLKIVTYTEYGANILNYSPWYLSRDEKQWQKVQIEESRAHGNGIIVKIKGIESPEQARLLTGQIIAITRDQLPELQKNEYYWSDLIGLTVINKDGTVYGTVSYLIETGSNDVLVVKAEKEHAIPFLFGTVITAVDLVKKEIHVDWELI